jgi:hypothetical protein
MELKSRKQEARSEQSRRVRSEVLRAWRSGKPEGKKEEREGRGGGGG